MKDARLNPAQMAALAPYEERYLKTWHEARWSRPLPPALVDLLLAVWETATASRRPFRSGCPTCERDLLADVCELYYKTKAEMPVEAAELAIEAAPAPKPKKAPAAKKKAPKAKKKAPKAKK